MPVSICAVSITQPRKPHTKEWTLFKNYYLKKIVNIRNVKSSVVPRRVSKVLLTPYLFVFHCVISKKVEAMDYVKISFL